jgi:hypothetical protein
VGQVAIAATDTQDGLFPEMERDRSLLDRVLLRLAGQRRRVFRFAQAQRALRLTELLAQLRILRFELGLTVRELFQLLAQP